MNTKFYVSAVAMKLYLIPLLAACLFFAGCSQTEVFFSNYSAKSGVFDCSTIDFTKEKPVKLKGEWKYRMLEDNPAFARPDYDDSEWDYIIIPSYWNSEKFKGDGYGWYRLQVKVNKSFWETLPAIYVPGANTAYELYFNGNKFMCSGIVSIDEQSSSPCLRPQLKPLSCEKKSEEFVIAVKVSNFFHRGGGLNKCIVIGPFESITQILWEHDFIKTVILGIIFIIAVYHLILWMGRRKDKTSFWFSIFCFAIFSHSFVIGNYLERIFYDFNVFFIRFSIEYGSLGLGWLSFTLYVYYLFPRESSRVFVMFQIITGIIFISISVIFPPRIFTNVIHAYNAILFITIIGTFIILIAASKHRRDDALLICIGHVVLLITIVNDILHNLFIIRTFFMSEYGLALFILFQSSVLSLRFARAFKTTEYLSENLNVEVMKKTEELVSQTDKAISAQRDTEKTYKKLASLYDQISNEVYLAKTIHDRIIPKEIMHIPDVKIAVYNEPFMQIGGDVYDIAALPNKKTRVFLADATGHGISASLITILIKVEYDKLKDECETPAEVFKKLNTVFSNYYKTMKMFLTAIMVDIDGGNNKLLYASAGHPDQFLVMNSNIFELSRTGPAIGISKFSNYENKIIDITGNYKLYLFTDGIIEEFNTDYFGNQYKDLKHFILESGHLSVEQTVSLINEAIKMNASNIQHRDDKIFIGIESV